MVSGKLALKYSGSQIDAMKAISQASKKRSLADFQQVTSKNMLTVGHFSITICFQTLKTYKHELEDDKIVNKHLGKLYQKMLEKNLCRIIEPYSKVQVRI